MSKKTSQRGESTIEYGQIDPTPILSTYPLGRSSMNQVKFTENTPSHITARVQLAAWIVAGKRWKKEGDKAALYREIDEAIGGKHYEDIEEVI